MESEGRTASINVSSQEILKKEDSRVQTQSRYNELSNNATKIFVGGLPADLTKDEFKAFFEKFGTIEDVVVMSDKETNKPRRFGFVTFNSPETANNVLKNRFYQLKNKRVEVKKAVSKERMNWNFGNYYDTYHAMYNGNAFPYGNYGGYYNYGMNNYGYGAYNSGLSYVYYPYQSPYNTCPYQSPHYYADTYWYQRPYFYGNTSKYSHKYRNRTPVVIKKNSHVNNGDGDHAVRKSGKRSSVVNSEHVLENGDGVHHDVNKNAKLSLVVDDKDVLENGDCDHGEISEGLSLCCNGDGGCALGIQALSLSGKQMAADGQCSSCTDS